MVSCSSCGAGNRDDAKFCGECGSSLSVHCPSCGTANEAGRKFCFECGAALLADQPGAARKPVSTLTAERRVVSVLFADLVGFTSASEARDAEDTRELLSRYFELARTLIERYGGTVEKFIGDAVMAVWGTPVATESDPERAVRAALDLVAAIPDLDQSLRARAGVLTGEAAVTLDARGEGMVAGDLVNTASRVQSEAKPGTVLVGDATRRATEQAIVYDDAGEHDLKGKSEPLHLWRALRVVSGVGGDLKSTGLEAPFVGRERELKLIKELFHGCAAERRPHLVSITGIAGFGKSRLAWEFYKYFDGIIEQVYWHRGRCLAYGEGVTYWALADMIRMRARIAEDEPADSAREKLRSTLEEHVPDATERAFVEPRLAHLLGLEDTPPGDRQDLFAAWRLFFERLADEFPTVLAFEDMHWADSSLLDFIEYLLEWSRDSPLFVVTLARPDLHERRPGWGGGQRNFTSLYLDPLPEPAMEQLVDGLTPGLPDRLRGQIFERSQGVPLYAVETVRMLLDRNLLTRDGPAYQVSGEVETLDVPETLQALLAARLDGLTPEERHLLQNGAVLGKTFTPRALAALTGRAPDELEPLLNGLVRKEALTIQSDPRSPERGQYGFLQDLVRHVAYETLAKRDRKALHLAAAAHLRGAIGDQDEISEVVASHLLAAVDAAPDADDVAEIKAQASETLARAGARAGSLGATDEGARYYEQAAELASDPVVEAELVGQSGRLATLAGRNADARRLLERAHELYSDGATPHDAARVSAWLADVDVQEGRLDIAVERLENAIAELDESADTPELAVLRGQLGRIGSLTGRPDTLDHLERALTLAEQLQLPEVLVNALVSKGVYILNHGRFVEARILLEAAAERALADELYASALRAHNNLAVVLEATDRLAEASDVVERAIGIAHRRGDRRWEAALRAGEIQTLAMLGRWDESIRIASEESDPELAQFARAQVLAVVFPLCNRGQLAESRALIDSGADIADSTNPQNRHGYKAYEAIVLRAEGRYAEALAAARIGLDALGAALSLGDWVVKLSIVEGIEAALALGDFATAEELLAVVESSPPGSVSPFLRASATRLRAKLDFARGVEDRAEERFTSAAATFREFSMPFYRGLTELEHGEWLMARDRPEDAQPHLAEALTAFEQLAARPWVERARAATPARESAPAQAV